MTHQCLQPALGHGIAGPFRFTAARRCRTGIDDRAALARQQMRQHRARAEQMPAQVDGNRPVKHRKIDVQRVRILKDDTQVRRVHMRAVQSAQSLDRLGNSGIDRCFVRDVDRHGKGAAAQLRRQFLRAVQIDIGGADPCAFLDQSPHRRGADAGRRPDNDDAFVLQALGHELSPLGGRGAVTTDTTLLPKYLDAALGFRRRNRPPPTGSGRSHNWHRSTPGRLRPCRYPRPCPSA